MFLMQMACHAVVCLLLACSLLHGAAAYYLPGTYPREFRNGQQIQGGQRVPRPGALGAQLTLPTAVAFALCLLVLNAFVCMTAADVNSLISPETELPFDYYSLPFCWPPEGIRSSLGSINPGTILMGSRIENSPYNFSVKASAAEPCGCGSVLIKHEQRHASAALAGELAKVLNVPISC